MRETADQPKARTADLIVRELPDEVLVYDRKSDRAHCLNLTAATIWKFCDGRTTAAEMAQRLAASNAVDAEALMDESRSPTRLKSAPPAEQVIWLALEQLSRNHLLEAPLSLPAYLPRMSRREAIRVFGLGAAMAIPIVVSITAPTPAVAGTCKAKGQSCGTGSQCCSKACVAGTCA